MFRLISRDKFHRSYFRCQKVPFNRNRIRCPRQLVAGGRSDRAVSPGSPAVGGSCALHFPSGDLVDCVLKISLEVALDIVGRVERWGVDRDDGDAGHRIFEADARESRRNRGPVL